MDRSCRQHARPDGRVVRQSRHLAARPVPGRRPGPVSEPDRSARHSHLPWRHPGADRGRQPERPVRGADTIPGRVDLGGFDPRARLSGAGLRLAAPADVAVRTRQRVLFTAYDAGDRGMVSQPPTWPGDGHQADRCGAGRRDLWLRRAATRPGLWVAWGGSGARHGDRRLRADRLAGVPRARGHEPLRRRRQAAQLWRRSAQSKSAPAVGRELAVRGRPALDPGLPGAVHARASGAAGGRGGSHAGAGRGRGRGRADRLGRGERHPFWRPPQGGHGHHRGPGGGQLTGAGAGRARDPAPRAARDPGGRGGVGGGLEWDQHDVRRRAGRAAVIGDGGRPQPDRQLSRHHGWPAPVRPAGRRDGLVHHRFRGGSHRVAPGARAPPSKAAIRGSM